MDLRKPYLIPRLLIGLMALAMAAATLPAYVNPTLNPGLANLSVPALSLGETAGAFLGLQEFERRDEVLGQGQASASSCLVDS